MLKEGVRRDRYLTRAESTAPYTFPDLVPSSRVQRSSTSGCKVSITVPLQSDSRVTKFGNSSGANVLHKCIVLGGIGR